MLNDLLGYAYIKVSDRYRLFWDYVEQNQTLNGCLQLFRRNLKRNILIEGSINNDTSRKNFLLLLQAAQNGNVENFHRLYASLFTPPLTNSGRRKLLAASIETGSIDILSKLLEDPANEAILSYDNRHLETVLNFERKEILQMLTRFPQVKERLNNDPALHSRCASLAQVRSFSKR